MFISNSQLRLLKISDNSVYNRKFSENGNFCPIGVHFLLNFSGALVRYKYIIKNPLLYLLRREALDDLSQLSGLW